MSTYNQNQLTSASNATYIDNNSGSITPTSVRSLNENWISSSVLVSMTSSITVGNAVSASYAATASFLLGSIASASFAQNAATASYFGGSVVSASYALNATSASYVPGLNSASFTPNAIVTASAAGTTITFTKGDSTTFAVTVSQSGSVASASYATFAQTAATASYVATASYAQNANLLDGLDSTVFVGTGSYNTFSSSIASRTTVIETTYATTGSNTFTGNNIFGNVTASNALITSASVLNLTVIYETASVIYSSGSNQFGDASDDVQTLWGTVTLPSGPLNVTGSVNASAGFTGSLNGTALTASYVLNAVSASRAVSAATATSASYSNSSTSASYALSSSYAVSSSYSNQSTNASYAQTASLAQQVSTSISSQNIQHNVLFIDTTGPGFVQVDGGLRYNPNQDLLTTTSSYANTANSASYALSSSYAVTSTTAATASSVGTLIQAVTISGSLAVTGSSLIVGVKTISGSVFITGSKTVVGSNTVVGTNTISGSFFTTGSTTFNGPFNGNVTSASIASNTSSLDFSTGNFYSSLVSGSTFFNITNPKVGQTVNVLLTTAGTSASASFSSNVKQVSGSSYAPTPTTAAKDILTFISWDGTTVYLANVKNLI